jgi:transcriptional regulator with XRE-family HTH domain
MSLASSHARSQQFGRLLQEWRRLRGKSQLELALDASVSPRHVSFVESGRSVPSRAMVITLACALHVPLRERNALLLAAGYAPVYSEANLDAPELHAARRAIDLILEHQEPYPAVVMNRRWDVVASNGAAEAFFAFLLGPASRGRVAPNVLRSMFDPRGLRPYVENWEAVAELLVQRFHREAVGGVPDDDAKRLLKEVLAQPGVPARWAAIDPSVPLTPFVAIAFAKEKRLFRYFSTVTTLGTPQDITLQELRVECFFPADPATEKEAVRFLASVKGKGSLPSARPAARGGARR